MSCLAWKSHHMPLKRNFRCAESNLFELKGKVSYAFIREKQFIKKRNGKKPFCEEYFSCLKYAATTIINFHIKNATFS